MEKEKKMNTDVDKNEDGELEKRREKFRSLGEDIQIGRSGWRGDMTALPLSFFTA